MERIRHGLSARGIDRALAEQTLAGTAETLDDDGRGGELARALELLRRDFLASARPA